MDCVLALDVSSFARASGRQRRALACLWTSARCGPLLNRFPVAREERGARAGLARGGVCAGAVRQWSLWLSPRHCARVVLVAWLPLAGRAPVCVVCVSSVF